MISGSVCNFVALPQVARGPYTLVASALEFGLTQKPSANFGFTTYDCDLYTTGEEDIIDCPSGRYRVMLPTQLPRTH